MSNQFWLGFLVSPFAIAATVAAGLSVARAWSREGTYGSPGCSFCRDLGWPVYAPEIGSHRRIRQWVHELAHKFRARRLPHRILWQQWADQTPRGWQPKTYAKNQKRYGVTK